MARRSSGTSKRPQAPAISLKRVQEMPKRALGKYSDETLKSTYVSMRKAINSRVRSFEKAGLAGTVPADIRAGLPAMGTLDKDQMINIITRVGVWIRGKQSTLTGYRKWKEHFRRSMQDAMPDLDLSDDEKLDAYGDFMGAMQDRYGEMWNAISNQARDIYRDLTVLNEDPYQFMANYDYWASNMEALNQAKAAARQRGRYSTKLSTYMNKLKAGKIK